MNETKRPISQKDLRIGQKIGTPKTPYFKKLDGSKHCLSLKTPQAPNREWINKFDTEYISSRTRRKYLEYKHMRSNEQKYWEQQIKSKEKLGVKKF